MKIRTIAIRRISRDVGGSIMEANRIEHVDDMHLNFPILYTGRVLERENRDATKC